MNEPSTRFLLELAKALRKATHQNVAEHMAAGLMWATWPEWFDKSYWPHVEVYQKKKGK